MEGDLRESRIKRGVRRTSTASKCLIAIRKLECLIKYSRNFKRCYER